MTRSPSSYFHNARPGMLRFANPSARTVFEVGCGHGRFGRLIQEAQGAKVTGIDLSTEAIEIAAGKLDHALVLDLNTTAPPFAKGEFGCIVCNDVLKNLIDPWIAVGRFAAS